MAERALITRQNLLCPAFINAVHPIGLDPLIQGRVLFWGVLVIECGYGLSWLAVV